MLMVWDPPKRAKNLLSPPDGHGRDFADARDRFEWGSAMVVPSHPGKDGNPRFLAIGVLDGDLVALVFAPLGTEAVSAISLRTASNRERRAYVAQSEA
ncbi:UNVERIFIED_CONTAM: BrnT family toxin [Methylobacteriaceae bacterium AG10]|nr:BrnT family toxin [Methylobacteriaceae bacterium AG10]